MNITIPYPTKSTSTELDIQNILAYLQATAAQNLQQYVITGSIFLWPQTTAPVGYINANGSNVSRTAFAALFRLLGTSFGVGDGLTTFGLPNPGVPPAGMVWAIKN